MVPHNVMPIDPLAQSAVLLVRGLNFRADMQIRPYCLREFEGAKRLRLCNRGAFSTTPHALPNALRMHNQSIHIFRLR